MEYQINYGDKKISVRIPTGNLAFEIGPKDVQIKPQEREEIERAFREPIGSPPLSQIASPGNKVAIIIDDHTRLTPTHLILPHVIDGLNQAGIPDNDIEIIVASGTHRSMTAEEKLTKIGPEVMSRIKISDHDCLDKNKLMDFGTTQRGTHLLVNADVMKADIRITVGVIFPHFPAGWGGGAKMLLPGIAGQETVAQFHLLGGIHADTRLGQVDTVTRMEMEEFASRVGLDFIFNVVLDKDGRILGAFAGDYIKAHRAGIAFARKVYEVEVSEPADLVISSSSPIDHDYFQVMKGLYSAEVCTKPGGEIILVSPIYEGMAVTHLEALSVTSLSMHDAMRRIKEGDFEDNVGAAIATYQIKLRDTFRLTIISEYLTQEEAGFLGVNLYPHPEQLQEIINRRLQDDPKLKIGVLHQSTEVLPRIA